MSTGELLMAMNSMPWQLECWGKNQKKDAKASLSWEPVLGKWEVWFLGFWNWQKKLNKEECWENTVLQAAHLLWQMYDCLSQNSFCQATFKELTRKFLLLYLALEQSSPEGLWKFTPKFHLLQELAEFDQVLPSLSWTYRDEDWGDLWQLPLKGEGAPTLLAVLLGMS